MNERRFCRDPCRLADVAEGRTGLLITGTPCCPRGDMADPNEAQREIMAFASCLA